MSLQIAQELYVPAGALQQTPRSPFKPASWLLDEHQLKEYYVYKYLLSAHCVLNIAPDAEDPMVNK